VSGEILFLAHRVPFPPNRGDKIRSWNVLKALAKIAPVNVCALVDAGDGADDEAVVAGIAASTVFERSTGSKLSAIVTSALTGQSASVLACSSIRLQRRIDQVLTERSIKAIYAFSGQMAQFVPDLSANQRFIMDFVDMDSAKFEAWANASRGPKAWANRIESKRLFAFEQSIAHRACLSLFVSQAEADLFRGRTGLSASTVQALENGIDLDHFNPSQDFAPVERGQGPLIVFTGQMDYAPNVDAVSKFARETLPLIRAKIAHASFAIVGRAPTPAVLALAGLPGVIVTGGVPDTRDWLSAADVVVAPLRLARGIQNKVLEAMAMAKAVVASPSAAEGIDAVDGRDLIVADSPADQAHAVTDLLKNNSKASVLARAARARMIARYSWESTLSELPKLMGFAP
jgi:polysaccharide biosynthesis protein PslH